MNKISFHAITPARRNFLLVASLAALGFPGCAAPSKPSLPVQGAGKSAAVSGVRTYERDGKVVVVGMARVAHSGPGSHVDVKLVAPGGRVVAEKTEPLKLGHPRGSQARHGSDRFAASFPVESLRGATSVVVSYHGGSHPECPESRG